MSHSGPVPAPSAAPRPGPRPPARQLETGNRLAALSGAQPQVRARTPPLFVLFLTVLGAICLAGSPYYVLSVAERVRSPLHPWLKPSGYIGQSAGLLALAI